MANRIEGSVGSLSTIVWSNVPANADSASSLIHRSELRQPRIFTSRTAVPLRSNRIVHGQPTHFAMNQIGDMTTNLQRVDG
jgi:hypothetical protein